jgi:predicted DNA-binding transcriptional regulator AlpA
MLRLLSITEVAEMLGVTRQRADQLSCEVGFPEPVRRAVIIDAKAEEEMERWFRDKRRSVNARLAFSLLSLRAHELPDHPRLWRHAAVEEWAKVNWDGLSARDLLGVANPDHGWNAI